jgi:hypothetical protein
LAGASDREMGVGVVVHVHQTRAWRVFFRR